MVVVKKLQEQYDRALEGITAAEDILFHQHRYNWRRGQAPSPPLTQPPRKAKAQ